MINISGCLCFSDINISQGSVATHLRCGGAFYYHFAAHLLLSLSVNNFDNWSAFVKVRGKDIVACFF